MGLDQEHLKFLGLFGIYRESYNIIFTWRKIFTQITLAFILPLSFISLVHTQLSVHLFPKIIHNQKDLSETQVTNFSHTNISDFRSSPFTSYLLFQAAYIPFYLTSSLLSTSAIAYTIGCIYCTGRDVGFWKVMGVVPKVWKRLSVTYFTVFLAVCGYHLVALIIFALFLVFGVILVVGLGKKFTSPNNTDGLMAVWVGSIPTVLYVVGMVCMGIIWQLAGTVSVLEDSYGFQAMRKSFHLIKGKVGVSTLVFLLPLILEEAFQSLVVYGKPLGKVNGTVYAIVRFSLTPIWTLFGHVVQTILYLVCKSYHQESIGNLVLADHLQTCKGEYHAPSEEDNVQLVESGAR